MKKIFLTHEKTPAASAAGVFLYFCVFITPGLIQPVYRLSAVGNDLGIKRHVVIDPFRIVQTQSYTAVGDVNAHGAVQHVPGVRG